MKPLVAIIVGEQSDLKIIELTQDVLTEFDIAYDTVILEDSKDSLEKLSFYGSIAKQKGIELIIAGGKNISQLLPAIASLVSIPMIHVPVVDADIRMEKRLHFLLETDPGDAHVAGLWAAEILAAKHWSIYHRLKCRQQVS